MNIQDFIEDFNTQIQTVELNIQKLQQQIQSEQQLFLKLQGAIEALTLYKTQQAENESVYMSDISGQSDNEIDNAPIDTTNVDSKPRTSVVSRKHK